MSFFASSVINPMLFFTLLHICIPLYFYFNDVYARDNRSVWEIYIPLCFYFNTADVPVPVRSDLIYIPLCFYFNKKMGAAAGYGATQFTFHYASTLIYFPYSYSIFAFAFTFHYASTLMIAFYNSLIAQHRIYIPLCFYFNRLLLWPLAGVSGFTFHYASTLIFAGSPVTCFPSWFTFHYASTLIKEVHAPYRGFRHLHSTMLLL